MKRTFLIILIIQLSLCSCEDYLDRKPDQKLAVPATLKDLQALLDDHNRLSISLAEGEVSADNYYITYEDWMSLYNEGDRRMYIWEKDFLFPPTSNSWSTFGMLVHYANTVLETIISIDVIEGNEEEYGNVKGQALFLRGRALFDAAAIWALAYDASTAQVDLGLPLRLDTDFNKPSIRSSVAETYEQIVADLRQASSYLPARSLHVIRPSKAAAYGMLSRVYLAMRDYEKAGLYADSCLQIVGGPMNYNELDTSAAFPFSLFNDEVIFESGGYSAAILPPVAKIKKELYDMYDERDLRKVLFFNKNSGDISFKGNYRGDGYSFFGGLAIDEILLNRAECKVRMGDMPAALGDLNRLLKNRWQEGMFTPIDVNDQATLLDIILNERRKELLMRGLRWIDIKRLNKEGAMIELRRELNGVTYALLPNDLRFALPIPEDVIELSGMMQNPR